MKPFERIPFLANVLIVACSRPNAEVGKLVKAVVIYVTEGTRTNLDDLRLQAYYDLLLQDIDTMRAAAEAKSKKCSDSAKCRTARTANSSTVPTKKANAANASTSKPQAIAETAIASSTSGATNDTDVYDESKDSNESIHLTVSNSTAISTDFKASDVTSSFDRLKVIYKKVGDNGSQAFGVWQQLSESERSAAFAHTQRLQGDLNSRSYLYVYLRDKEWTKAMSPVTQ